MAKSSRKSRNSGLSQKDKAPQRSLQKWFLIVGVLVVLAIATVALLPRNKPTNSNSIAPSQFPPATVRPDQPTPASELVTMDVAKAVMVTVELDFGPKVPTIAEALTQIERRYQPDDGQGRTFAVLDAYGGPTAGGQLHMSVHVRRQTPGGGVETDGEPPADGKRHMSMHVSSEKPGGGQLIFKLNGEVLWRGKINPTSQPVQPKSLTVLL